MRASRNLLCASAAARHRTGVAVRPCFLATLLFALAASAQDETPPKTTPADERVQTATEEAAQSPTDGAIEPATDEAGELQQSGVETDEPRGQEIEDLASETEEPVEIEPIKGSDIEEILIRGEAGQSMIKDQTVSVVGFDMGDLQIEGIKDIRDLSNFTPSLEIKSAFAASNPTIYIRGVGLDDFNANAASAVAIYQDGVYMQSPAGQLFQFYDVERVEVLRGPQGTLYRNASAGAILLNGVRPSDEYSAYLTASTGNFDMVEVEGAIGGPIVPEVLSYRLSGTWGIRDGLTKNRCAAQAGQPDVTQPELVTWPCAQLDGFGVRVVDPNVPGHVNNIDAFAARGQLLFAVPLREDSLEWLLNVHGGRNLGRAYQYQHRGVKIDPSSEEPTRIGGIDGYGYKDLDRGDVFAGDYNVDGPEDIDVWGASLKGTWLFGGDAYELQSLTAYEWNDRFTFENTDAGSLFGLESAYENTAWQLSQQLDLRGQIEESNIGDGDWTLGFYYLQEDLDVTNFFDTFGSADLFQTYNQEMWNLAPYAQMEYRLEPGCEPVSCDFSLLAGVRYNVEHKSFDTVVIAEPGGANARPALVGEESETWTGWSGELTLTWNFYEDSSLFGKFSRGWKGGHFNGGATSSRDIITGVEPEIVESYEAGLRSFWFDGRLNLDVSAFYYDYQDLQVFIIEQTEAGFPITKLVNASDALVYGVELDLQTEPIPGLDINYHAAWVESEYEKFTVSFWEILRFGKPCRTCPPPPPVPVLRTFDYSGNTLIASPRFSMTGSIEYAIPLPGQIAGGRLGTLSPRFSFSWKDSLLYDPCGGRGTRCNFEKEFFGQKPIWVFNAALTWRSEDDMISVSGWVRNFMDEHYKTQSFDLSRGVGLILDAYADPRTYGVTATISF